MRKTTLIYLSAALVVFAGVSAFGQVPAQPQAAAKPAVAAEQPAPAPAPAQPAVAAPQPAPAPAPAQPAVAAPQPAPAPAPAQPAVAASQPAPAPAPAQPAVAAPQPAPAPAQPAQPQAAAQNKPQQKVYAQGYGQPPAGFFGYYGYPPPEENKKACSSPEPKKDEEPAAVEKEEKNRSLHAFSVVIPIESETYDFKRDHFKADASHFGVGGSWNRVKVGENPFSSIVGIGVNYVSTELDGAGNRNLKYSGIDANLKFGFGAAPVRNNFILAIHIFFAFDYKMEEAIFKKDLYENIFGETDVQSELEGLDFTAKLEQTIHSIDLQLGGDLILAYQFTKHFGVIGGVDISSNMIGAGVMIEETTMPSILKDLSNMYGEDMGGYEGLDEDKEIRPILYYLSGINIVPHIGVFFTF